MPPGGVLPAIRSGDSTAFYAYVQTLSWGHGSQQWRCTDSAIACFFGTSDTVRVLIETNVNSHAIEPMLIPASGVVVARMRNMGRKTTRKYGLRPQTSGYEYYLVVYPDTPRALTSHWRLQEVSTVTHAAHPVDVGEFYGCRDHEPSGLDSADFRKCSGLPRPGLIRHARERSSISEAGMAGSMVSGFVAGLVRVFGLEPPAWISCNAGCCEFN